MVPVLSGCAEWQAIEAQMKATMPASAITKLERVQNVMLWEYYCMRKERMARLGAGQPPAEVKLWHGTSQTDPKLIYEDEADGFMMQYCRSGMWGRGLYFAQNASYSGGAYAHTCDDGTKCVLYASLLSGDETHVMPHNGSLVRCPDKPGGGRYDTVTGDTGGSKVYIVYENGRAYPEYLVTYR
jgi:hypothetical protein